GSGARCRGWRRGTRQAGWPPCRGAFGRSRAASGTAARHRLAGLLDDVVSLADRAEHPVGHRQQVGVCAAVLGTVAPAGSPSSKGHVLSSRCVILVTNETGPT